MTHHPPTDAPINSPWMLPPEAAAYLRIALGTLRNWTASKYVPHAKRGRVVRYHRAALDRWLAGLPIADATALPHASIDR